MVPQGPPAPVGGAQPGPPTPLRSNSGLLSGQGSGMPSHNPFLSSISPHNQFNNTNMLGNASNVSSLLQNSFGNGGPSSGLSVLGKRQHVENGAESDPFSSGTGINPYPYMSASVTTNPNSSVQVQGQQQQFPNASGNQMVADQLHTQQLDPQNFQHNQKQLQQFSIPT